MEQLDKSAAANTQGTGAWIGCLLIALALCLAQISGSKFLIAAVLAAFLAFHIWACFRDSAFCVLLFFLPWSPLLRLSSGSISFFTIALLATCLFYCQKNEFKLELYQIIITAYLAITTLIAKGIQSNPIANSYLFFFAMLLLFPCVVKGACKTASFEMLTFFFASGIIAAALSAQRAASYSNISQYIKVDSYLTITRLSGYYKDPNFYSAHITACLAGIQMLMSREKRKGRQLVWAALFIALIYCGMLSASKSFVVVLAGLFLVWIPIILERGNISGKFSLILGVLCAGAVFLSTSAVQELLRIVEVRFSYASDLSELTTGRTDLWLKYWNELTHNAWLTLFGEGYSSVTLDQAASHNTIIQSVFQFGLLGAPALCIWVACTLKKACNVLHPHFRFRYTALMCMGAVFPWMALDILFFDEFFLLPVYAVIGAAYANRMGSGGSSEESALPDGETLR